MIHKEILVTFLLCYLLSFGTVQATCPSDDTYINSNTVLSGEFCNVADGNERGVLIINSSDVILDCNGTTLKGNGSGFGINIPCDTYLENVTVKNCKIVGYDYGIELCGTRKNRIFNNHFINVSGSIALAHNASENEIYNNTIEHAITVGIRVYEGEGNRIYKNRIISGPECVRISNDGQGYCDENVITGNLMKGCSIGLFYQGCKHGVISNNTIIDSLRYGIFFNASTNVNELSNNNVSSSGMDDIHYVSRHPQRTHLDIEDVRGRRPDWFLILLLVSILPVSTFLLLNLKKSRNKQRKVMRRTISTYILLILTLIFGFTITLYNVNDLYLSYDGITDCLALVNPMENYLMFGPYHGINFLLFPFLFILGFGPFSFRLAQSIFLLLTILTVYLFARDYYEEKTALVASFLLCVFPYFILMRHGEFPFLGFYAVMILFLAHRYHKTKRRKYLYSLCLVSGFATYFNLMILYLLLSLAGSYILIGLPRFLRSRKFPKMDFTGTAIPLTLFLIGASPLIFYNFMTNFSTIGLIMNNFVVNAQGYNNLDIPRNILIRADHLKKVITSPHEEALGALSGEIYTSNMFNYLLFLYSLLLFLPFGTRKDLYLAFVLLLFLILSTFVPDAIPSVHLFILTPMICLIIARSLTRIYKFDSFPTSVLFAILITVFFISNFSLIANTLNNWKNQTWLERNQPNLAMVHLQLGKYLRNASKVVIPSDVQYNQIRFAILSSNREHVFWRDISQEILGMCKFDYSASPVDILKWELDCEGSDEILKEAFKDEGTYYVFPSTSRSSEDEMKIYKFSFTTCERGDRPDWCHGPFQLFREKTRDLNRTARLEYLVNDSLGSPVYEIYSVS